MLLVSNLTKNLLSISQITTQFSVNCELSNVDFYVKEQEIGQAMIAGNARVISMSYPLLPNCISPIDSDQALQKFGINASAILNLQFYIFVKIKKA